ncbi:MAG: T9SS C-terminal target domain-containing protein, partial [Ignavibacteriota bacterium]
MYGSISILVISFFLFSKVQAQPVIEWQQPLGGSDVDCSYSVLQTSDAGYIVLGHEASTDGDVTINHGGLDFWVTKLDSLGKLEWQDSYGGSQEEAAYSMKETFDGGYILMGYSYSDNGDVTGHHGTVAHSDCWVVKIDHTGNLEWEKSYGGSSDDIANAICQTADGGYIFVGYTTSGDGDIKQRNAGQSDIWVVRLDNAGNIMWQKTYGGSLEDEGLSILQTTEGGFIFTGYVRSLDGDVMNKHGDGEAWVVKIDANGKVEWQQTYGGHGDDNSYTIDQTKEGGYILAGFSASSDGDIASTHGAGDFWV